jgi:hypothetical protein
MFSVSVPGPVDCIARPTAASLGHQPPHRGQSGARAPEGRKRLLQCRGDSLWYLFMGAPTMGGKADYALFRKDGGAPWAVVAQNWEGVLGSPPPGAYPSRGPGVAPVQLDVVDSQTAYLLGACQSCDPALRLELGWTTDGGVHWENRPIPEQLHVAAISFFSHAHGWAVATRADEVATAMLTSDGGASWESSPSDL